MLAEPVERLVGVRLPLLLRVIYAFALNLGGLENS